MKSSVHCAIPEVPNFFKLFEQFQKLVLYTMLPIFRNVDGSWCVTSKGSTLIQVARRCSKVFQRFSASLVRVGDVQGVSRRHAVRGKKGHTCVYFWGCRKKWKNSLRNLLHCCSIPQNFLFELNLLCTWYLRHFTFCFSINYL